MLLLIYGFVVACASSVWERDRSGPVNAWWEGQGPVVPHENFPGDCTLCHLEGDWQTLKPDFEFDHGTQTGVVLQGAHADAQCLRCHNDRGPVEQFAAQGCVGCHGDVHQGAQGVRCETCHGESDWSVHASIADHNQTRFPLVGAHAGTACRQCHLGIERGQLEPLATACESCHLEQATQVANPDHVGLGWVSRCDRCHRPTQWGGVGFTHATFPLTGQHASTDCTACHTGGVFAGTPRDCYSCHTVDYQNATDPDHQGLGFSTSCEQCHNTTQWEGAVFNHSPIIQSADHDNLNCNDCHTTPSSAAFSCIHCHEHRQSEMDDEHDDVGGYTWESSACFACHPNGVEDLIFQPNHRWRARPGAPRKSEEALERFLDRGKPR